MGQKFVRNGMLYEKGRYGENFCLGPANTKTNIFGAAVGTETHVPGRGTFTGTKKSNGKWKVKKDSNHGSW